MIERREARVGDGNEITQHLEILRRQGCNQFETCGELERLRLTRPFHERGGGIYMDLCATTNKEESRGVGGRMRGETVQRKTMA